MKIFEDLRGDELTLSMHGIFDESTCPHIEDKISEVMGWNVRTVFLDMNNVKYISSAGIRILIIAHKKAVKNGKTLVISGMSEKVKEILETVGILPLFGSRGGARA